VRAGQCEPMRNHNATHAKARFLADLPPAMSKALVRCHTQVVLVRDDHRVHGVRTQTINALVRHELIEEKPDKRARPSWKPTANGLRVIKAEEPRLLAARSQRGYTAELGQAVFDEPEAIDEKTLNEYAKANGERFAAVRAGVDQDLFGQQRSLKDRLAELERLALARGVNARSELRLVERGLDALERKIRDQRNAA
jgi:hypothetical protein